MDNQNKFTINPTNEFHILRHFEFVDDVYKKTLVGEPYWYYDYAQKKFIASYISENDIECALATIGTKFSKNIAGIENQKKLLELIKEKFIELNSKNEICWNAENENKRSVFSFKHDVAVGKINCLLIDKLSDNDKQNIKPVPRSNCAGENNIMVNTVSGIELVSTDMIYVDIFETTQLPFFVITSFPDCSATNNLLADADDNDLVFVV